MNDTPIVLREFTKAFGSNPAVNALNLKIPRGSIYGFLGANGAGKTTTIRAIMGHLHPTSGEVLVLGKDPWSHTESERQSVAYVSENMSLPAWMTAIQAVRYSASLYPKWDGTLADKLLDEFELRGAGRYKTLSKGQRRRLCILIALCQNAEVLVMDEPCSGLDVSSRHNFLEHLLYVVCDGERTVFLSSHILSDLERVVDRVGVISRGTMTIEGELESLKQSVRRIRVLSEIPREVFEQVFTVIAHETSDSMTAATVLDFDESKYRLLCGTAQQLQQAQVLGFNLEDLFVELDKHSIQSGTSEKETRG